MTVTLTYNEPWAEDCTDNTDWTLQGAAGGDTATFTVENQTWFKIDVTGVGGDGIMYVDNDNNKTISSTYAKALIRYKTSDSSVKAKVVAEYSDASTETLLAETSSTTWKTATADLTYPSGKTLDHIRFHGNQALGQVYYDFIIIHANTFTFPHVASGGIRITFPNKLAHIEIPGRSGDIIQNLGMKSPEITIMGNVLQGEQWQSGTFPNWTGPHFEYLLMALNNDPWGWLTCTEPYFKGKVMFKNFFSYLDVVGTKATLRYEIQFVMHTSGDLSHTLYGDTEWGGYES